MAMSVRLARLRTASWFGWMVEGNWADPVLFTIYVVARPLAMALMLALMYRAVRGHAAHGAVFAGFYVANAFHAYVDRMIVGMGWAVFEEREEFETLKYVFTSPMGLLTYLAGRSSVKFTLATISVTLMLLMGWFVLGVHWDWARVQPLPLAITLALGLAATLFIGFLLAGWSLILARSAIVVLDGVSLGMFLLCGVIFPVDLLPRPLQAISLALPFTWWYEALRRFLLARPSTALLAHWSDLQILAGLAAVTVGASLLSLWGYRAFERHARRIGRLDQTTLF